MQRSTPANRRSHLRRLSRHASQGSTDHRYCRRNYQKWDRKFWFFNSFPSSIRNSFLSKNSLLTKQKRSPYLYLRKIWRDRSQMRTLFPKKIPLSFQKTLSWTVYRPRMRNSNHAHDGSNHQTHPLSHQRETKPNRRKLCHQRWNA